MRSVDHARLLLSPPKHGWMPIRLELDEFVIEDAASNVLNDPLAALIEMFRFSVTPMSTGERVCLWLEPDGYAIDVLRTSVGTRSVLNVYYDRDFVPPMQKHQMARRFECELDTEVLCAALFAGLSGLIMGPQAAALDTWRRDESLKSYRDRFNAVQAMRGVG